MRLKFKIHGSIIARPSETMKFEIISGVDCWVHFIWFQEKRSIFSKRTGISINGNSDFFTHVGSSYVEVRLNHYVNDVWWNLWTGAAPGERIVFKQRNL